MWACVCRGGVFARQQHQVAGLLEEVRLEPQPAPPLSPQTPIFDPPVYKTVDKKILDEVGYMVVRMPTHMELSHCDLLQIKSVVRELDDGSVANTGQDGRRRMTHVGDKMKTRDGKVWSYFHTLRSTLETMFTTAFQGEHMSVTEGACLLSLPGCPRQVMHRETWVCPWCVCV